MYFIVIVKSNRQIGMLAAGNQRPTLLFTPQNDPWTDLGDKINEETDCPLFRKQSGIP